MGSVDISGVDLARSYYQDVVAPLLAARWPGLPHAGARLGGGSDVLGVDDAMSRDHDWGLRLTLLVDRSYVQRVVEYLEGALPRTFLAWPTRFATTWDPKIRHRVEVDTPEDFAAARLGVPVTGPLSALDWLSLTGQSLLEVTGGAVFTDTHGRITAIRDRLAWYPDDVWRYVMAADWSRIGQELPLLGRTGVRGDEVGSRVLAGRLVHTAMHLGFVLERRWPPYPKWLGTLFTTLPSAGLAVPALQAALSATTWQERQEGLCEGLVRLHDLQRRIGLPVSGEVLEPFFDRPFRGVRATVVESLLTSITDTRVLRLPAGVGSVEQWVDNVDVLATPRRRVAAATAFRSMLGPPADR
jgi:hypothetical protein